MNRLVYYTFIPPVLSYDIGTFGSPADEKKGVVFDRNMSMTEKGAGKDPKVFRMPGNCCKQDGGCCSVLAGGMRDNLR